VDLGLASFRERHGREGGETNADSEILEESFAKTGGDPDGQADVQRRTRAIQSPAVTHLTYRVVT
jgi:hypothetical protein